MPSTNSDPQGGLGDPGVESDLVLQFVGLPLTTEKPDMAEEDIRRRSEDFRRFARGFIDRVTGQTGLIQRLERLRAAANADIATRMNEAIKHLGDLVSFLERFIPYMEPPKEATEDQLAAWLKWFPLEDSILIPANLLLIETLGLYLEERQILSEHSLAVDTGNSGSEEGHVQTEMFGQEKNVEEKKDGECE